MNLLPALLRHAWQRFAWRPAAVAVLGGAATALTANAAPATPNVMPAPAESRWDTGRLAITPALSAVVQGPDEGRVRAALDRALRRWEARTGFEFPRTTAGEIAAPAAGNAATLVIVVKDRAPAIPSLGEDETYTLDIDAGQVRLQAPTSTGAIRGLATLTQLLQGNAEGWSLPAGHIADAPRFPWRGLLIDVARHWMPLEVIERNLDGMELVKLNVLHLHLTDDQGFAIESRRYPRLHRLGSEGHFFTADQIRTLLAYAAARGIRVVPEFDVPGHATTWAVAYPELASAPGPYTIERHWGVHDVVLDPTNEALYPILDGFFGEMAALFPDAYVHIGGDENNGRQWTANPRIQAFIRDHDLKNNAGLHAYFNRRLQTIVTQHGKIMVGWDEILHPELPAHTVVQSWRGGEALGKTARMNFAAILSHGYYLDHLQTAAQYYLNDPLPADTKLTPEEQRRVLGGEACIWAEWVTPETIDSRTWPNAAAIAERLWSPRDVNDVPDMYRRLALVSARLDEAGLLHWRNREALLRQLAGDGASPDELGRLRELADLFEAGTLGLRSRAQRGASVFTPLTGFADCAHADSAAARDFQSDLDSFLFTTGPRSTATAAALSQRLAEWKALGDALARGALVPASPRVREIAPLGEALRHACEIGTAALDVLAHGQSWSDAEARTQLAALDRAGQSQFGVTLPLIAPLRLLVAATAREATRAQSTPAAWRAATEALAASSPRK